MNQDYTKWKTSFPITLQSWPNIGSAVHQTPDEVILYIPASGDLHIITKMASHVLNLLKNGTHSAPEVFESVSNSVKNTASIPSHEALTEMYLLPFEKLGVIERVS
jgi:hypothetical protein